MYVDDLCVMISSCDFPFSFNDDYIFFLRSVYPFTFNLTIGKNTEKLKDIC